MREEEGAGRGDLCEKVGEDRTVAERAGEGGRLPMGKEMGKERVSMKWKWGKKLGKRDTEIVKWVFKNIVINYIQKLRMSQ
ncbi:putative disease resistance RPP13-like protein 1 [Sesbania bispinosa]|nr:putative disease resistance RPP13-like protein 1 [Sesbania bispinosa]